MTRTPRAATLRPRPTVGVVIPALDEERAIGLVIDEVPDAVEEIIVVDNGSSDRTADVASRHGARVVFEARRGYGAACRAGIDALSEPVDVVVFLDGDHSDFPDDISALLDTMVQADADLVIGSRTLRADARRTIPHHQRFGNWLAVTLIRWLHGHAYSDLGPLRAIRRNALNSLELTDGDYGWNVQMQVEAVRRGLAIREVPVRYRARIGRSKIGGTVVGSVRAGIKILRTLLGPSGT